jgi:adenosylcobinamide kinase/adenosylcobinamide-phosphate guanylyltransferase
MLPKLSLVLGGAASGKSDLAERLVEGSGRPPVYIATGQAHDAEMARKISRHRDRRGPGWQTLEAPLEVAAALPDLPAECAALLDCATFWLSNHMFADSDVEAETARLLAALAATPAPVVVVSNEVGQGIVPENALARRFRNAQGRLNRQLAAEAQLVVGVMAGLPIVLKGEAPPWL